MDHPTTRIEVQLQLAKAISCLLTVAVKIDIEDWQSARDELEEAQTQCADVRKHLDLIFSKFGTVRR